MKCSPVWLFCNKGQTHRTASSCSWTWQCQRIWLCQKIVWVLKERPIHQNLQTERPEALTKIMPWLHRHGTNVLFEKNNNNKKKCELDIVSRNVFFLTEPLKTVYRMWRARQWRSKVKVKVALSSIPQRLKITFHDGPCCYGKRLVWKSKNTSRDKRKRYCKKSTTVQHKSKILKHTTGETQEQGSDTFTMLKYTKKAWSLQKPLLW